MSRIRGRNTTPERYLFELLRASRLEFVQHDRALPGCPDFIFFDAKLAVFVNGDFWHGWRLPIWQHKLGPFWRKKIVGNRSRDQQNLRKLRRLGWRVLRIWEHQVEEDAMRCIERILKCLECRDADWDRIRQAKETLPLLKRRNRLPKP